MKLLVVLYLLVVLCSSAPFSESKDQIFVSRGKLSFERALGLPESIPLTPDECDVPTQVLEAIQNTFSCSIRKKFIM